MDIFFASVDWQGWIADRSWLLIWIGFFASGAFALFEHGDLMEKLRASTGKRKYFYRLKLCLLWSLPIIALLAAAASQWGSDKADRKIKSLETDLINASREAHTAITKTVIAIMSARSGTLVDPSHDNARDEKSLEDLLKEAGESASDIDRILQRTNSTPIKR